jgi:glutamate synthase (NADPH) small chain
MNNSLKKVLMPHQSGEQRQHNFEEVTYGYDQAMALEEAQRCLQCRNAKCIEGCPVSVNIPGFIQEIKNNNLMGAYEAIAQTNAFPSICGRVCPQENQCEANCVRNIKGESVGIGRLERFVGDWYLQHQPTLNSVESNGHRIAIVGSGPAGLSCANICLSNGFAVTMFEILHQPGGVLSYGIPEFRLPKKIVNQEIDNLIARGLKLELNTIVGSTITIEELFAEGYEAVFIGSGAGLPKFLNIPGEQYSGVFSANEYLTRVNLMKANNLQYDTPVYVGKKVVVVGGGNVAMDAARVAKRLGSEVHIVYRRSMDELPARGEEVLHAQEEDIIFHLLENPVKIIGNDQYQVCQVEIEKMTLGEPDQSGRRQPIPSGETYLMDCDCVIVAVGTTPNPLLIKSTTGLTTTRWGGIVVDDQQKTSLDYVYAGGDAVSGAATVILAMGAGKQAAQAITSALLDCKE